MDKPKCRARAVALIRDRAVIDAPRSTYIGRLRWTHVIAWATNGAGRCAHG